MSVTTSLWWPEDRIQATLCPEYVFGHLPPDLLPRLVGPLPWGEGLTNETYLDWILNKAGRLFLILVDIGISERIFSLVDESFDDVDLPIAAHSVDRLNLSPDGDNPTLDAKFFHAQWRFLVRGLNQGDHVKYTENEGVPVELLRSETALAREGVEKVVLAGAVCRVYLRTQVTIGGAPHFFEEEEVLEEIRSLRRLSHDHVFSIYASYFVDDTVCILFSGIYDRTLMSFITDVPQHFKRLPKNRRREILINWPHCLVDGLSWLHAHRQVHGAIRPSNILIDLEYRIFLGQFEALDTLLSPIKIDDVESYQYGAPERWVRSAVVQDTGPTRTTLPSGGRTGRRQSSSRPGKLNLFPSRGSRTDDPIECAQSPRAESVASHGTAIRIGGLPDSPTRFSFALSSSSGSSGGSTRKRPVISIKRPILYSPSITSSNSSDSSGRSASMALDPVRLPGANSTAAVVQTWQSRQTDPEASDIFSLGAVILDILTHLCKRKISAFAHHRGAKNRTAGRGGGVVDCSFHLDRNIGQVSSWIALLDNDARKRKDPVFRTVESMLPVVRCMLDKEPAKRPSAARVESRFIAAVRQEGGMVKPHCTSKLHFHVAEPTRAIPSHESSSTPVPAHPILTSPPCTSPPSPTNPPPQHDLPSPISPGTPTIRRSPSPSPSTASYTGYTDWTDTYTISSDSDPENSDFAAPSPPRSSWRTSDGPLRRISSRDSVLGYGVAVTDG